MMNASVLSWLSNQVFDQEMEYWKRVALEAFSLARVGLILFFTMSAIIDTVNNFGVMEIHCQLTFSYSRNVMG